MTTLDRHILSARCSARQNRARPRRSLPLHNRVPSTFFAPRIPVASIRRRTAPQPRVGVAYKSFIFNVNLSSAKRTPKIEMYNLFSESFHQLMPCDEFRMT
jgi:hypothetical protein